jgi:glycosyltransferase involved in cell wall biosynthesis
MKPPRISVLMGVFNAESHLARSLESLQRQTETRWECIVVDDASTDGSARILRDAAASDERFQIVTKDRNEGLTAGLMSAFPLAAGTYIARQDADDWSAPERFQRQADFLDLRPDVHLLASAFQVVDAEGEPLSVSRPATHPWFLSNQIKKRNPLAHGSLMIRSNAFRDVGGYRREFRMAQDYDLILRLAAIGRIAAVPDVLYFLRLLADGGSLARLDLQENYARQARGGAAIAAPTMEGDAGLGLDRYRCLKALHLIKSGRGNQARRELAACRHPAVRSQAKKLALASRLPAPLLRAGVEVRRWREMLP